MVVVVFAADCCGGVLVLIGLVSGDWFIRFWLFVSKSAESPPQWFIPKSKSNDVSLLSLLRYAHSSLS